MTRVLICGNCGWPEEKPIRDTIRQEKDIAETEGKALVVISGMAPGADMIAWEQSDKLNVYCDEYPWNKWGKRKNAVIVHPKEPDRMRNQWMLDSGVDYCYAYAYDLRVSFGTRDMVNRCVKKGGIEIYWFDGSVYRRVKNLVTNDTNIDEEMEIVA